MNLLNIVCAYVLHATISGFNYVNELGFLISQCSIILPGNANYTLTFY